MADLTHSSAATDDDDKTPMNLQELAPSPIDETPTPNKKDSYFPTTTPPTPRRTHSLGLSAHTPIWYLLGLQKYSTYVFSAFAVAHVANTSLVPLLVGNVPDSERYLLLTRPYYQGFPAEALLIVIPVWTHVLAGLGVRILRRGLAERRYGERREKGERRTGGFWDARFWPAVSGISRLGFQLVPLLVGHAYINRVIPGESLGGSSNVGLNYVSHAFARHPVVSYVGFSALVVVGVEHFTWGWAKWLGWTPDQVTVTGPERQVARRRRWYGINGLALALTGVWMAGSFGVIARGGAAAGWVGKQYDEMYRKIPLVGKLLY